MRLGDLARRIGATIDGDADVDITGLAPIEDAGEGDLTFVASAKYRKLLTTTGASAIVVGPDDPAEGRTVLRAPEPYAAFVQALAVFDDRPAAAPGIHPTAAVAESASVGTGASIGPYAVIGDDVTIGAGATIHPHVVIYAGARIGDRFTAHAGAVVREKVVIGDDVTLQPGAVIGGDGFGFLPRPGDVPATIPQIGTVEIADSVDIGANSTVDRAAVGATRLARGVKLDNLVMIAHGCTVGEGALLAAQFGVAGSSKIGKGVMAGGQVGVSGHLEVGDGARLAAQTGVAGDVGAGATVAGSPATDIGTWRRYSVLLGQLPRLVRRLRDLEARLEDLVRRIGDKG